MGQGFTFGSDLRRLDARVGQAVRRWTSTDLEKVGAYAASKVRADSMASFRNQADPSTGAAWKPSKRATGAFRKATAKFQAGKRSAAPQRYSTLEGPTGRLRRGVAAGFEVSAGGKVTFWGGHTPLVYAAIHQFGGVIRPKKGKSNRAFTCRRCPKPMSSRCPSSGRKASGPAAMS